VYSDNSGTQKAVWVFNTADQTVAAIPGARELGDLESSSNTSYELYKATAEVTFRGLTSAKVTIDSTNYKTSDLHINQAIKQAINSDPVLSKLLKATDGPANTLVVTSLIDGDQVADTNLSVAVVAPAAGVLTAAEITAAGAVYTGSPTTENAVLAAMQDAMDTAGDYVARFANDGLAVIDGEDSNNAADSTHTLGAGNDVLVLSTNHDNVALATTNATSSNETVVYNAIGFGADTIVNFNSGDGVPFGAVGLDTTAPTVAGAGEDKLDFTALGGRTFTAGTGTTAFGATVTNVINVRSVVTTGMDDATDVATLFAATTNPAAQTHIVVLVNTATNVGSVYQVSDAAGAAAGSATAALIGTIDLADTSWLNLSADNFA
jgi:hypothetical protein